VHDLLVDEPPKDHLDNVHRLLIGDPHPLHKLAFLADTRKQPADLGAAAMDHDRIHTDELHQHDVAREPILQGRIHHGVAPVFDHEGLALELSDIGKRLDEEADG